MAAFWKQVSCSSPPNKLSKTDICLGETRLADNWKSTTKALLRITSDSHPKFIADLREHVIDVLAIVGRSVASVETEALLHKFEEKLSVIARLAIRLHMLVNDGPSSLETFVTEPGAPYQSSTMEDTYADDEGGNSSDSSDVFNQNLRTVICSSDLGLKRAASKGPGVDAVVIKPKVVLATILAEDW